MRKEIEVMVIKIPQEKYPVKPVREAFQREGFRYSKKESSFIGKVTDENRIFLKLLGLLKE